MERTELRDDSLIGVIIDGRYRVTSLVAQGGMGTVYRAEDTRLDRVVALKVMHPSLAADPGFVARFEGEARAAARLSDPHVVGVFDQGSDGDLVWLAMDYVRGFSLREVIDAHAPLEADRALGVVEQILGGLAAAHRAGFVHGDIKPENVVMTGDGTMKVTDFGLARAAVSPDGTAVGAAGRATAGGMLLGTAAYVAPESVTRGVVDEQSDVYATGVVLFELLTGQVPFDGPDALAVANRHVHESVPLPSEVVPGLPSAVDAVVARATARDPQARFATAREFLAAARAVEVPAVGEATTATGTPGVATGASGASPAGNFGDGPTAAPRPGQVPTATPSSADNHTVTLGSPVNATAAVEPPPATTVLGSSVLDPSAATSVLGPTSTTTTVLDTSASGNSTTVLGTPGANTTVLQPGTTTVDRSAGYPASPSSYPASPSSYPASPDSWPEDDWPEDGDWGATADPAWAGRPIRSISRFGRTKAVMILTALAAVMAGVGWWLGNSAGVAVPNVAGQTAAQAQLVLAGAGVGNTEVAEEFDASTPEGVVLGTSPPTGTVVPRDGGVTLIVSKGPEPVVVPNLTGQSVEQAKATLEELGLVVVTKNQLPFVVLNRVISQDTAVGSEVPPGTTITLRIV